MPPEARPAAGPARTASSDLPLGAELGFAGQDGPSERASEAERLACQEFKLAA